MRRLATWLAAWGLSICVLGTGASPAAAQPPAASAPDPHAGHVMPAPDGQPPDASHEHHHEPQGEPTASSEQPPASVRPLSDEDRAAAFPVIHGDHQHTVHGQSINTMVLFEQLEWRNAKNDTLAWDSKGWIGRDLDKFWVRSEGDAEDGGVQEAQLHALYGRAIARWWELVAGVRQDWRPGAPQTWVAFGIQGIAPQFFDVELSGYVGGGGRTHVRLETSYDLLLTQRLVLQPLLEFEIAGKADPRREVGQGLTVGEISMRLRYEVKREFAPYVGLLWRRTFFGTADLARRGGREIGGGAVTVGGRFWF